jgi:hypothetical protein
MLLRYCWYCLDPDGGFDFILSKTLFLSSINPTDSYSGQLARSSKQISMHID